MNLFTPTKLVSALAIAPLAVAAIGGGTAGTTSPSAGTSPTGTAAGRSVGDIGGGISVSPPSLPVIDDGEDDPGGLPIPPQVAVQLTDLRTGDRTCLDGLDLAIVLAAVRDFVAFDAPDVRSLCIDGELTRIGVWPDPTSESDVIERREDALYTIPIPESYDIGFHLGASYVRSEAKHAFWDAPRRYNEDGRASSSGPIVLDRLRVDFYAPDLVVTEIDGRHTDPIPDIGFTLSIADEINLTCLTSPCDGKVGVDRDELDIFLATLDLSIFTAIGGGGEPQGRGGAGAEVLALLPREIALPDSKKLILNYQDAWVEHGIVAGGVYREATREPALAIVGPRTVRVAFEQGVASATFSVDGIDTFGDLDVVWTGDGAIASPTSSSTAIQFIGGLPGQIESKTVRVEGTDEDGAAIAAEIEVLVETYRSTPDGGHLP
jgi:hypothetical protein